MASLIKKAPALLATAREVATPKLNTFWRYAKVGEITQCRAPFNLLGVGNVNVGRLNIRIVFCSKICENQTGLPFYI